MLKECAMTFFGAETTLDSRQPRRGSPRFEQPDRSQTLTELDVIIRAADNPLTIYPELPQHIRCIDTDRRVTSWDPLDGPLPQGWRGNVDGWENPEAPASWSVVP
jgi:hypothetical protein